MNENAHADTLRERARAARSLAEHGDMLGAERAFADLLRDAPDDLDALNFLAICAHGRQRPDEAFRLLEHARAVHPRDAATLTNLGVLYLEQRRLDEACDALRASLDSAPDSHITRLRLAEAVEAGGRPGDALPIYFGAIVTAQNRGQWISDETTPPGLRSSVLRAVRYVAEGRRRLFGALLTPLRERFGGAALARVERCVAAFLGELQVAYPQAQQRPKFLYFPDLPSERFLARDLFPWYADFEANASAIRDEMLHVLGEDRGFEPFLGHVADQTQLQDYLRGDRGTPAWNAFFFYRHGVRNDENAQRCPRTAALLDAAPLCRIRGHAPEACFSVLTPGSHLLPHHGVTNTRVVTHVPLVVPEDCALVVGGEVRAWREGECFSFDDTFLHEAWNRSAHTRVVMLMDAWNPHLTEAERFAVTDLIGAIGDFNRAARIGAH